MNDVVYRVLSDRVAECIKEAKGEVRAGINGQVYLLGSITWGRRGLRSANWRLVGGAAHCELVVILGEWLQSASLHFEGVVDV